MKPVRLSAFIVALSFFNISVAYSDSSYPFLLYSRLTGVPLSSHQPDFQDWKSLIDQKDWPTFAKRAVEQPSFLDVTVLQWATLYYTAGKAAELPLDDALATLVGSVRDNLDARLLLSGDYQYGPISIFGVAPSVNNNDALSIIEQRGMSLSSGLEKVTPQWNLQGYQNAAGLLTTRSWAQINYNMGTNRRAVRAALETFMCRPIDSWRVPNLPTVDWIRRDVDRAPGGDARVFQQECRSCHGTLDPMSLAFSHLDYVMDSFMVDGQVRPKYLQHPDVYPEGYVPTDDAWINSLAETQDPLGESFGWRGKSRGHGVQELGESLAQAQDFSRCLAKRVYSSICYTDKALDDPLIVDLANQFESADQYHLKDLFVRTALRPECISH